MFHQCRQQTKHLRKAVARQTFGSGCEKNLISEHYHATSLHAPNTIFPKYQISEWFHFAFTLGGAGWQAPGENSVNRPTVHWSTAIEPTSTGSKSFTYLCVISHDSQLGLIRQCNVISNTILLLTWTRTAQCWLGRCTEMLFCQLETFIGGNRWTSISTEGSMLCKRQSSTTCNSLG